MLTLPEILVTSGEYKSNTTVLHGLVSKSQDKIITSSIEHDAILNFIKIRKNGIE